MGTTTTEGEILDIGALEPGPRPSLKTGEDRRRVLLVEDDPPQREFLATLLQAEGYRVDSAASCLDAFLQVIRTYYHCLVLDLLFPEVDGLFLYEQVRRLDPDLARRTVLITGSEEGHPLLARARRAKLPILRKPLRNRDLLEILSRFCGGPA
ncbi:MAG: response regulator [Acidobacteria bacterium]|nr:response regulator [Acidobacteriota bacterium]